MLPLASPRFPAFSIMTLGLATIASLAVPASAHAAEEQTSNVIVVPPPAEPQIPAASTAEARFAGAIAAIRAGQWDMARAQIDALTDRRLAAFARAELYLAARSPRVEGAALASLLSEAPDLPQSAQLARLAATRGVTQLPALPTEQRLGWAGSSPRRRNPRSISDPALGDLPRAINERIVADDPAGAEALLNTAQGLSAEARTEWQHRVAWSYYIENDDSNARRLAAVAQAGSGEWQALADWTQGLASWRQNDCRAAMDAFRAVSSHTREAELRAAGHFWYARAATACAQPQEAQPALRRAAALDETFYGLLAAETLGYSPRMTEEDRRAQDLRRVEQLPNVRTAIALAAARQSELADETLRYQARIGAPGDHAALLAIAGRHNLPETQFYLAHNAPAGTRLDRTARFPAPQWVPANGWRIIPALMFAHMLEESQFRPRVVSSAGAVGLMQVRPGTAGDMRISAFGGSLTDPAVNMAMGQNFIEHLRDHAATGGLLPKVIAAYNAGLTPVTRWNGEVRDNGDPLLWIESLPYWETRAYVGTVFRNLWVYEQQLGTRSDSRAMLARGRWPRVPTASDVTGTGGAITIASTRRARGGS